MNRGQIIILLLLISIPAVKSLFIPGGYTSHDLTYHIMRQISMDQLLSEGQFPPRWSGQLNEGFGYPVFLFNYQLPSLIGEIFHKAGFNFVDSVKAVFFLSLIISVVGMYLFLKELLNSDLAAFLGAIFYLYAPIRFSQVYVSAAAGAALAAGILPFVFYFMKKGQVLLGGLALALLILSHNFTTVIFMPVILTFAWMMRMKKIWLIFILGMGLSCWFWLPALFEKQYLRYDQIYQDFYQNQFITVSQLLHSPWGYGLSHPQKPEPGDMSYQLGLIHIMVVIIYLIYFLLFGRKQKGKMLGIFVLAIFIISVFLILKISLPVWQAVPILAMIQFPLRWQIVAVFAASITAGLLVKNLPHKQLLFFSLLLLVLYANRNHLNVNEVFNPGEKYYLSLQGITSPYGEDLPKWAKVMDKKSPAKLEFIGQQGKIKYLENKSHFVLAEVEATGSAKLRFNQFYFPGWQIKTDSKAISFNYKIDGESYGLMFFDISQGKHQILAEFKNTPDRNLADAISIITVIIFITFICRLLPLNLSKARKFS